MEMCTLLGVSRAGYYRNWRLSRSRDRDLQGLECTPSGVRAAPAAEETALRDRLQQLALAHRHYGYRRLGPLLRHEGWTVNHKRVLRLMREDDRVPGRGVAGGGHQRLSGKVGLCPPT
jgi:putative transposase